jgi:hypothetical protein
MDADEQTTDQRRTARIRQEVAEFEADPRTRAQAALDRWVESQRADAAEERRLWRELDPYNFGHWRGSRSR